MKLKLALKKKQLKALSDNNSVALKQTIHVAGGKMDPPSFACDTGYFICGGDSIIKVN
ncbi:hypothetical protein PCIT_b1219 [Pseudoalteromonas citrea]|uniref:Uncharacterized protein n=1 Tax=Pseudoalteromonas citrea TaxID=43655 RepID=A0AAD4FQI3_9GAMM|nr:hypothetical protein [Pseudoalteromonas citrea]KAF7765078.1 hypothetical protein PCIT_b1219 [Pseudoalteromonas citrea]